jgi:hypothetical protein
VAVPRIRADQRSAERGGRSIAGRGDDTTTSDECAHDLDAAFIYPSDVDVLETANDD